MAVAEDFNSSDIEINEAPVNPYAQAGFASIQAIQQNQFENRAHSKKRLKTLTDVQGAPGTQYVRNLYVNRFNAFRATSRNGLDGPPSGDNLIRFVEMIVRNIHSSYHKKMVMGEELVKCAIAQIVAAIQFQYPDYKLTTHNSIRLDAYISRLRQEDKLTKGKWRKARFVGFGLI